MSPHLTTRTTTATALLVAVLLALMLPFSSLATGTNVANPDLLPACGTKVILVLDESGSISNTAGAETAVRQAANAFASGLADTGSQLAVIEFGSSAKRVFGYTNVTSGAGGTLATTFQPYFNGTAAGDKYDSPSQLGQWTNWQDALEEVKLLNTQSGVAPLVVFVTDGDPTAMNTANGVATNVANATALAPAVVEANAVKTQGSHILAVGVGSALANQTSLDRLKAVSGPDVAATTADLNISTTDVLRVTDFSTLPDALRSLVSQLCQSSVTVNKLVDEGQGYVPGGAGWSFDANVSTATGTYTWVTPQAGPAGPRTAATGADSAVTFQWKPTAATTSTVTLTEATTPGYQFVSATCKKTTPSNQTPQGIDLTTVGSSFSTTVGSTDIVTCTVKNKKIHPKVAITKDVDKPVVTAGEQVTYTITVTNIGDVALNTVEVADAVTPACAKTVGSLAVGESHQYTCTATITEDTTNVAVVTAKGPYGTPVTPKQDDAVVDVIAPAVSIEKSVDKPVVISGTEVTYTITVTNTGDAALNTVEVADAVTPACAKTVGSLAVGESHQYTCTATITQDTTNVAIVTAKDPRGVPVAPKQDDAVVDVIAPALSIEKSVDKPVVTAGTLVTWTITVTNTGDVDLTNVEVTDPVAPGCDTVIGSLAAGATAAPITCTSTIDQATVNTATVTGTDPLGGPVPPKQASAWVDLIAPNIAITKAVDKPVVLGGTQVTWTITVTNTGDVALANVTVTDPVAPACDRVIASLPVDGSEQYTCTSTIDQDTVNTATVTAIDPLEQPVGPASATAAVDVIAPAIAVTKTVDQPKVPKGTVVTFTITVTNPGDVTLTGVAVSDPATPACDRVIGSLEAGASTSYTCTTTVNADLTNVATATGTDPLGNPLSKQATATVTVTPVIIGTPDTTLSIDKRGPAIVKGGAVITYSITIKNTGTVVAENVVMRDTIPASMSLVKKAPGVSIVKGKVVVSVGTLAPGASKTIRLQFRIDRRASGFRTNVATASASNAKTVRDTARTRIVKIAGQVIVPRVTG